MWLLHLLLGCFGCLLHFFELLVGQRVTSSFENIETICTHQMEKCTYVHITHIVRILQIKKRK